jgi:hypothetical protein
VQFVEVVLTIPKVQKVIIEEYISSYYYEKLSFKFLADKKG